MAHKARRFPRPRDQARRNALLPSSETYTLHGSNSQWLASCSSTRANSHSTNIMQPFSSCQVEATVMPFSCNCHLLTHVTLSTTSFTPKTQPNKTISSFSSLLMSRPSVVHLQAWLVGMKLGRRGFCLLGTFGSLVVF